MPKLTPEEIQANKDLGLHEMFWETAIVIPENPTPEWMTEHFPSWREVGQRLAKRLHMQIFETGESEAAS